jgi:hypothetical protein
MARRNASELNVPTSEGLRSAGKAMRDAAATGVPFMPDAYVAVTLAGVQEFISASRRTADLSVSSMLMSRLCAVAVSAVQSGGGQVVLPQVARQDAGLPNRLFAVVPAGHAARLAGEATKAIRGEWHRLAKLALPTTDPTAEAGLATFPFVRWVAWDRIAEQSAPAHAYGYLDGWRAVGQASAARRRVRDFSPYIGASGNACSLCGRRQGSSWSTTVAPRVADGERLCAVCVIKRSPAVSRDLAGASVAFPSTASVAVAPFRARVREVLVASSTQSPLADAVREHQRQVRRVGALLRELGASDPGDRPLPEAPPGLEDTAESLDEDVARWFRLDGGWLQQDTWQPLSLLRENRVAGSTADQVADLELVCRAGRLACVKVADGLAAGRRELQGGRSGEDAGRSAPAVYLALMVQDADDMGSQLSAPDEPPPGESPGEWPREWHRRISAVLAAAAGGQAQAMRDGWGRAVYAGGDDLVGLLPAAQALPVAQRCREVFVQRASGLLRRPRVSTGLVFFHHSYPLQEALHRAREALAAAKARPGKDQLSVVVLRRGGERAAAVLPWTRRGTVPAQSLAALADAFRGPLSAGLLADVHRERWGIAELAAAGLAYQTEMLRLVNRHWSTPALGPSDADSVPARLVADLEPSTVRRPEDVDAWLAALEVARFLSAEAR